MNGLSRIMSLVRSFLNLFVVTNPGVNAGLTFQGAMPNSGSLVQQLNILQQNAQYAGGGVNFVTSAGTSATLTALGNYLYRYTAGSATTITIDYAYNIVAALPQPVFNGQKFGFEITTNASTTIATPTLSSASGGVTLGGTTSVLAASHRWYNGQITQLSTTSGAPMTAGSTFVSIAQIGSTNAFTLTLGTNALVPVEGQVIFLGVTAGTLPAGWYPILKVTSATSMVIGTPPGTVWTATAATVPGTTTVPASQYTPGLPGVYSPLVTITGTWALVVSTASV